MEMRKVDDPIHYLIRGFIDLELSAVAELIVSSIIAGLGVTKRCRQVPGSMLSTTFRITVMSSVVVLIHWYIICAGAVSRVDHPILRLMAISICVLILKLKPPALTLCYIILKSVVSKAALLAHLMSKLVLQFHFQSIGNLAPGQS